MWGSGCRGVLAGVEKEQQREEEEEVHVIAREKPHQTCSSCGSLQVMSLFRVLGRKIRGYLEKVFRTPMAPGRSTRIISMIEWIRTSRLSIS